MLLLPTVGNAEADKPRQIEEIIITAQKVEQDQQDVPISITVMDDEFIQAAAIGDLREASTYLPNVRVEGTSYSSPQVFIRGFGTNSFNPSFEPSVAVVIDDIYFARPTYLNESSYDLQRFEVLRGPQSTIFGRNTTAGVLKVVSQQANLEGFSGALNFKSESYGDQRVEAAVNTHLSNDLALRVSVLDWEREGRIINTMIDRLEDTRDQESFRLSLLWQASFEISHHLKFQRSLGKYNFWPRQLMALEEDTYNYLSGFDPEIEDDPYNFQTSFDFAGKMRNLSDTLQLTSTIEHGPALGAKHLTSTIVVSHSDLDARQTQDLDASPADLIYLDEVDGYDQQSAEWRLSGYADSLFGWGQDVEFLAGAYSYYSHFDIIADVYTGEDVHTYALTEDFQQLATGQSGARPFGLSSLLSLTPIKNPLAGTDYYRQDYYHDTATYALFGQFSWHINEHWQITPGIRLNYERKYSRAIGTPTCTTNQVEGSCISEFAIGAEPYDSGVVKQTDFSPTPALALSYHFNDRVNIFTAWRQGFKSGGINALSVKEDDLRFEPEEAETYEIGLRSRWLQNSLMLNITAFRMNFSNLQVLAWNGVFFDVTNAASAYSEGLETDLYWLTPWSPLSIRAAVGLLNARYKAYPNAPSPVYSEENTQDLAGKSMHFAPETTATIEAIFDGSLGPLELQLNLNLRHQGSHYADLDLDPNARIKTANVFSAYVSVFNASQSWRLTVGAKNLTDERSLNQVVDSFLFPGSYAATQNPGRSIYGNLQFNW